MVNALGTMAVIVGIGWLLSARGTLGAGARPVLSRACFAVATPCMLFVTVAHADLHLLLSHSALVAAGSTSAVALIARVTLKFIWRRPAPDVVIGTLASSYVEQEVRRVVRQTARARSPAF